MPNLLAVFNFGAYAIHLRYLTFTQAAGLFAVLAGLAIFMGYRALRWLGPGRQWTIIGFRVGLLYLLVMLLAGAEAVRSSHDLEVVVLRDVSASTDAVQLPAKQTVEEVVDAALRKSTQDKPPADRIGQVAFDAQARVESLPQEQLHLDARSIHDPEGGTDIAAALRLGLACFRGDAMKRLVLMSDGNATQGDLDTALDTAAAAHVPVDVVPLDYAIADEVMIDRFVAPVWRRQGEPFHLDVVLRSSGTRPVRGRLSVTHQGIPIDLDPDQPGIQGSMAVTLHSGTNVVHVTIPPTQSDGLQRFRAHFDVDGPGDTLPGNNSAEAFTFVRGRGRVLYVDNYPPGEGDDLLRALRGDGVGIRDEDRILPSQFPTQLIDLQSYDAVILANVPHGPGGLQEQQAQLLARYVRDTGGGLLDIGGPDALGAGGWQGSELEKVLPVNLDVPSERALPAGALMIVIDHSGSMGDRLSTGNALKMQAADEAAVLAVKTMMPGDYLGVLAFDSQPTWIVPLTNNYSVNSAVNSIRQIGPAGGTDIFPALEQAANAVIDLPAHAAAVRHVILLTDGQSPPGDYPSLIARMRAAKVTLSTIAVGADADKNLLDMLAKAGGGHMYVVDDPKKLTQVFIREARTIRRSLIQEPPGGIGIAQTPAATELLPGLVGQALPKLSGMVLSSRKPDPQVQDELVAANKFKDPILSSWQIGLGRVAVFTGDATRRWSAGWIASGQFEKFWTQLLRGVSRAPMSGDFDVQTVRDGSQTKLIVEALADRGAMNGLTIAGSVAGPNADREPVPVHLSQTGPGRYEATVNTPDAGTYVTALQYQGPAGERGTLLAGLSAVDAPERRDLTSDDARLIAIARRTGGRVLSPLGGAESYDLFDRTGLEPAQAFLPLTPYLLPLAIAMLLLDVAVRRLQIDRPALAALGSRLANLVRGFTVPGPARSTDALGALRKVRERTEPTDRQPSPPPAFDLASLEPKRSAPHRPGASGPSITAGATKPVVVRQSPPAPKPTAPQPGLGGLLEAKRRAQQKMKQQTDDPA